MHSHMGTRLPFPLPRAAASKNRLLSSSATALLLATALGCGVTTARHRRPPLLPLLLAAATAPALTRAPAAGVATRDGENTEEAAATDSIALAGGFRTTSRCGVQFQSSDFALGVGGSERGRCGLYKL